jgi:hypothetical protein
MNKSYSKIRHIQESNQRLEKRLLNEQNDTDEDFFYKVKPSQSYYYDKDDNMSDIEDGTDMDVEEWDEDDFDNFHNKYPYGERQRTFPNTEDGRKWFKGYSQVHGGKFPVYKRKKEQTTFNESNLKLKKGIMNEGLSQTNFKVGQKFKEVHNRQFIMSKSYLTAGKGGGAHNYNDFAFNNPIVLKISNVGITLKIDSGMYNPNDEWKNGQKFEEVDDFCLEIPYNKMQEIRDNQLMLVIPNSSFKSYIVPCPSSRPGRVLN